MSWITLAPKAYLVRCLLRSVCKSTSEKGHKLRVSPQGKESYRPLKIPDDSQEREQGHRSKLQEGGRSHLTEFLE